MHKGEYDKLVEIFESEERYIVIPKKNYEAISSEVDFVHSDAKCQLYIKMFKPLKSKEQFQNINEYYSNVI